MILKNCVLLLKSQKSEDSADKYEELLRNKYFQVKVAKTLIFDFKNIELLSEKLENHDNYCGIILSSPRCVQAVNLASSNKKYVLENYRDKYNFVVGEATYRNAFEKLHLMCRGKESGNAVNLSKIILEDKSLYTKPFLFPHGNLKTDTLQVELGKENVNMEGVLVYDTISNPDIEDDIANATNNFTGMPEFIVFFSPSGLRSSIPYLKKVPVALESVKLIAIGPVTELALKEEKLPVYGIAKNPTPEEVVNVICS